MSERSTVARPYAQAVFEIAQAQSDLPGWSDMLQLAAAVASQEDMEALLDNPRIARDELVELLLEICGDRLTSSGQSMVKVLAANRRLGLLPDIARQYEQLRAEAEKTLDAELISAMPVSDAQREKIAASLKERLGREINLVCKTDKSLLGGAVIRAGDLVIDGSARGRLHKLASAMSHA